jgi:hypothetical protein
MKKTINFINRRWSELTIVYHKLISRYKKVSIKIVDSKKDMFNGYFLVSRVGS